ncbi:MAG: beta-glucosidase-like glycosyl hydrolase [Bacteroidetes bacterium]|nr:MAG: beta-glucosidase-like glycosyl hydrolase [Bacteroidota bacterium]
MKRNFLQTAIKLLTVSVLMWLANASIAQSYKDSTLPVESRVQDLIKQMTPKEKFWQLFMIPGDIDAGKEKFKQGIFGFQVNTVGRQHDGSGQMLDYATGSKAYETAVKINHMQRFFVEETRLGIPIIPFDEALHGLVREGATAFPQAIALAATWNTKLMHEVAKAIANESKSRGIRQILSPVVNIANDVRWGRTEETYGEDPFLASAMGVAFVSAMEQMNVITTPKHFVANVGDGGRDSYPIHWNERYMREIHFPPFEACIKNGGSRSIMTAYNSYDGRPSTSNNYLLNKLLKEEWGFKGFVISDAGATGGANVLHFTAKDYEDATSQSLENGLDVIFQTNYDHEALFSPPFYDHTIPQSTIDSAVARVLRLKFELGLFDNPYVDPEAATTINGNTHHRDLAKKAALESIVLLKNNGNTLPVSTKITSLAVIGQDAVEARLGGYSGPGITKRSILQGISDFLGNEVDVRYAEGCLRKEIPFVTVPADHLSNQEDGIRSQGLIGKYFSNLERSGEPVFVRNDKVVDFQWTLFSPDPEKITYGFYSVAWDGYITADSTATINIGIDGNDGYQLWLDDQLVIDRRVLTGRSITTVPYHFEKGRPVKLNIEYSEPVGNAWFRLVWDVGAKVTSTESIAYAAKVASQSDVAIVVAGIEEGEFQDRAYLNLPGHQEELIREVAATGTPTIVILVGGSAVTMHNWLDKADAVLDVWYPGEAGGDAVAEVLFGEYNPAGRLPITFPVFEGQLPLVYNHKPTGRGDDYHNLTGQPLFPFGFGLSYTDFIYSDIRFDRETIAANDSVSLTFKLKNSGKRAGDEVVQLYLRDELASVSRPVIELKGFQRVHLQAGETKEIKFSITPELLQMLDINLKKVVEPGTFVVMVGASSKDIRLRSILKVI